MNAEPGAAAAAFSVRDCDAYVEHLAETSTQQQGVIAAEEIRNASGAPLLRGGTRLGTHALERLAGQRLPRAVDESFHMLGRLDAEALVGCFVDLVESEPDLARIEAHYAFAARIRHLCHTIDWPDPLLQKLSVMQHTLPKVFHRALFCAWLAALIAVERRLEADEIALLFQAGLYHDLGLLHIPPALVDKKTDIGADEWNRIQDHVEIGARIVEQSSHAAPRLLRLLREHHERHDGAGYPAGRAGADLDPASPVIALADMLHAQRFQSLLLQGDNLADCMPYLRVNRRTFGVENYGPAGRILLRGRDPAAAGRALPARAVQDLLEVNHSLATLLAELAAARSLLAALPPDRTSRSLVSLVEQVQWVTLSSGLGDQGLEQWLGESIASGRSGDGIAEMQNTAKEVIWLVRRFDRQLRELLEAQPQADAALRPLAERVSAELERAWDRIEPGRAGHAGAGAAP